MLDAVDDSVVVADDDADVVAELVAEVVAELVAEVVAELVTDEVTVDDADPVTVLDTVDVTVELTEVVADDDADVVALLEAVDVTDVVADDVTELVPVELTLLVAVDETDDVTLDEAEVVADDVTVDDTVLDTVDVCVLWLHSRNSPVTYRSIASLIKLAVTPQFVASLSVISCPSSVHAASTSRNTITEDHFASHRVDSSGHILTRSSFSAIVNGKHIFVLKRNAPQRCRFGNRTAALTHKRVQNIKLIRAIAIRTNILCALEFKARKLAVQGGRHGGGSRCSCRR